MLLPGMGYYGAIQSKLGVILPVRHEYRSLQSLYVAYVVVALVYLQYLLQQYI